MLLLASSVCGLFKWRQFEPEMILLAVGWYLRFSLSYRDVEELLAERGLRADHVTVWRWVQRYAPEMERRLRSRLKPTNDSWRVDETYIRIKYQAWDMFRLGPTTNTNRDAASVRNEIDQILQNNVSTPFGGLAGEKLVNVLEVNLQLCKRYELPK
jgi:hypothetical protein